MGKTKSKIKKKKRRLLVEAIVNQTANPHKLTAGSCKLAEERYKDEI